MTKDELNKKICTVFGEVYEQQEGSLAPELEAKTVLMETGLDSLGFAILVTALEENLGYDPFSLSDEAYYPVTFGDFVDFYFKSQPE
ncbi:hypothetical protein AWH62_15870 [Maricaulis sp. W15]|uniref:Acyl carrier protein n=1 Tax=Maricaulis maris TaxID=74318 RepID=A0A495D102_9PROT|nr:MULTISPECIES: hypothetical protein [Maricaulis]OLF78249.1 hypothetical protein AWH62_15870 [Maricaulis sp. W15]RKQ94111.1 hypothetical protein C7435_3082 [Maricaulis maris]